MAELLDRYQSKAQPPSFARGDDMRTRPAPEGWLKRPLALAARFTPVSSAGLGQTTRTNQGDRFGGRPFSGPGLPTAHRSPVETATRCSPLLSEQIHASGPSGPLAICSSRR
jgi:hypothetical protein